MDKSNNPTKYPRKDIDKKDDGWEYKKRAIQSASPLGLIIILYEEAIHSLEESKKYIGDFKTLDIFNKKLFKAADIIKELRFSLDMSQGEVAENLDSLYEYMGRILVESGISKKPEPIDESIKILEELLASWKEVEKKQISSSGDNGKNFPPHFEGGFSIKG